MERKKGVKGRQFKTILASVWLGLGVGIVFGIINLFISGQPLQPEFHILYFLTALSPGILEEICYQLMLFAFCLYL